MAPGAVYNERFIIAHKYACVSRRPRQVKDHLNNPGSGLSGGQRQCLCIARTIAVRARSPYGWPERRPSSAAWLGRRASRRPPSDHRGRHAPTAVEGRMASPHLSASGGPMSTLQGKRVAILTAEGFEQSELIEPRKALDEAGATTLVVSPEKGRVQGWNHYDKGESVPVDVSLDQADPADFD